MSPIHPFLSYTDIAATRFYQPALVPHTVAGAIQVYDIPDLMAYRHAGKLLIIEPMAADGSVAMAEQLDRTYAFPRNILNLPNRGKRFELCSGSTGFEVTARILEWLK